MRSMKRVSISGVISGGTRSRADESADECAADGEDEVVADERVDVPDEDNDNKEETFW